MKKSVKVTVKSEWSDLRKSLDNTDFIKDSDFTEYFKSINENKIELVDIKVPLGEMTEKAVGDVVLKDTIVTVESKGPDEIVWSCNNLGTITIKNLQDSNIKVTFNLRPKINFIVDTFLKGLFLAVPAEKLQETVQELIEETNL